MKTLALGVFLLVATSSVVGCAYPVPAHAYRGGYYGPSVVITPAPPVVVAPAPPPVVVAPAPPPRVVIPRGYIQYTYYPSYNVYLDPITGLFWFLQGGGWVLGHLPPHVAYERLGRSYVIVGEEGRPWHHHPHHGRGGPDRGGHGGPGYGGPGRGGPGYGAPGHGGPGGGHW